MLRKSAVELKHVRGVPKALAKALLALLVGTREALPLGAGDVSRVAALTRPLLADD